MFTAEKNYFVILCENSVLRFWWKTRFFWKNFFLRFWQKNTLNFMYLVKQLILRFWWENSFCDFDETTLLMKKIVRGFRIIILRNRTHSRGCRLSCVKISS